MLGALNGVVAAVGIEGLGDRGGEVVPKLGWKVGVALQSPWVAGVLILNLSAPA